MKKLLKRLAVVAVVLVAMFGVFAPRAFAEDGKYTQPECDGLFQDFTCTTLDHAAAFISKAYEIFADWFLEIDAATFDYEYVGSPGHALHTAWNSVRNLSNLAFAFLLFIVVISQVTGIGISNYGIKKMLPRMVAGILMVNLSYLICQGAIDLSNIFGVGLGSLFEDLMIDSIPPDISFQVGGSTALKTIIVAVVGALVIATKGLGSRFVLLLFCGFIAIVLAVIVLFIVSVVRQALCLLLVVFSPVAFVCYMLPGTKSIFNKWFTMFKAVILAYPICSLMVYGGGYAGAVLYGTWTDNGTYGEVLRDLSFLIITTVPYFFIPAVMMKSLTAAESAMMKLGNSIKKNGRAAADRTRFMTDQRRRADQDQQLARAGYKRKLNGDVVFKRKLENASDGRGKRLAKRAYNAALSLNSRNAAPYVRNAIRIQSEERRANAYRRQLRGVEDAERKNFYVYNTTTNKYEKVTVPLTNRQIRTGMYNGMRLFRATKSGSNLDLEAGSSDFEHTSAGDASRIKRTARAKFKDQRLEELKSQERNLENAAWRAQIKNDNMNVTQVSAAMKAMAAKGGAINSVQLSAYASALIADGAAGRDELEALLGDTGFQQNVSAVKELARCLTKAEMNSIKKKNPILWNKLNAINNDKDGTFNVGDLSRDNDFEISESQLDGLAPKNMAEMDASAQKRVVENLLAAVEADPNNVNNVRVIKALALAEGALGNVEIRAMMSPEQVANLEQIKGLRRTAVEAELARTVRSDRAEMKPSSAYAAIAKLTDVGDAFCRDFEDKFLKDGAHPGGNMGVLEALTGVNGCDTTRIEAITHAANAQLDEILRGRGLVGAELSAARDNIMRGLLEKMDGAIRKKSNDLIKAVVGADADDTEKKRDALKQQLNGATSLCDVMTQRINMRS